MKESQPIPAIAVSLATSLVVAPYLLIRNDYLKKVAPISKGAYALHYLRGKSSSARSRPVGPLPQSKEDFRTPSSILTRDRHMLLSLKGHSMVGVLSPEEKKSALVNGSPDLGRWDSEKPTTQRLRSNRSHKDEEPNGSNSSLAATKEIGLALWKERSALS
ncbi:hypothetical protein Tco_0786656 [Tanacetum coccineum]